MNNQKVNKREHILLSLIFEFAKIGLFTIGGGLAMIPLITDKAVNQKKWITESEMLDCITLGQSMPGVIAINTATYIGYKKAGVKGAFAATLGVILPSFLIIIALANIINQVNDNNFVQGAFAGIKACVAGLVLCVAFNLGNQMLSNWLCWVTAILSFIGVIVFDISAIIIVIVSAIVGIIFYTEKISKLLKLNEIKEKNDEVKNDD